MDYGQLLQLYFSRSNMLFGYWTLYVAVIGGILAASTFRQRRDRLKTVLIAVLYICFAYKNCTAIGDVIHERDAILGAMRQLPIASIQGSGEAFLRGHLEPTLGTVAYPSARRFHIATDVLTLAALWGMERRRRLDGPTSKGESM